MNKTSFMGDKPVNRIRFGAMQLAGPGVFGPPRDPGRGSRLELQPELPDPDGRDIGRAVMAVPLARRFERCAAFSA